MPTVPNWIAKGYVVSGYGQDRRAYPVISWRATRTQVVVTIDNGWKTEVRFRLDDLTQVGARYGGSRLTAPDSSDLTEALRLTKIRAARYLVENAYEEYAARMRRGERDIESVVASIGNVQRAATKAMADLADLL